MNQTLFYSWQSDLPEDKNRNFIRSCLTDALKNVEIAVPLRRDEAAEGESGTPDIPAVIFRKLIHSTAAVFDVTPITKTQGGKAVMNPNVAIELGYAAHAMGWQRVICVFNKEIGKLSDDMPFDLRHRRNPIAYDSGAEDLESQRTSLTSRFKEYIGMALAHPHREAVRIRKRLTQGCILIIDQFGKSPCFSCEDQQFRSDVERMLDLDVIETDVNPSAGKYAYHWTGLGLTICDWYHREKAGEDVIVEMLAEPSQKTEEKEA